MKIAFSALSMRLSVVAFCSILLVSLCGCAGDKSPKTTDLRFLLVADELVNPNDQGEPSPVVVRIYELKNLSQFQQASFFELFDDDTKVLGADLVGKREFEVKPGEKMALDRPTPGDTRYIGVLAGFRNNDTSVWQTNIEITPEKSGTVVIALSGQQVNISLVPDKTFGLF